MEFEKNMETYYSTRNYTDKSYTFDRTKAANIRAIWMADLISNMKIAKMKCLAEADREVDETMFAIEKDEEYLATFKECCKTTLTGFLDWRSQQPGFDK